MLVAAIGVLSTAGYVSAGWSLADAAYMVILTIFSVGYGEVRPIDTPFLRTITITTIALGCTAMILLTGALVQYLTAAQLRRLLGLDRMQAQIERLSDHVVICGFGRIGVQLSKELHLARRPFVVIERDLTRCAQAQAEGYLHINGEATDEDALRAAGIAKARILATVLPDDAANVFITLSARNMNPGLEIIARGEVPTTESKLYHAGADRVVLPTHIGAERIAEMILYPATADYMANSAELNEMKRGLHEFGLELEMVEAAERGALTGETVGEAERLSNGAFFIVRIERTGGQTILHPTEDVRIEAGDRIALLVRGSRVSAGALFTQRQSGGRTGRMRL
jgi:voltage-gated potassium channel